MTLYDPTPTTTNSLVVAQTEQLLAETQDRIEEIKARGGRHRNWNTTPRKLQVTFGKSDPYLYEFASGTEMRQWLADIQELLSPQTWLETRIVEVQ